MRSASVRADLWLIAATAIWGLSFVLIKDAVGAMDPLQFLGLRFGFGAVLFAALMMRSWPTRAEWAWGAALGALLWLGNVFQTVGMVSITPSRSAFLTSLSVVLVPLLVVVIHRHVPPLGIWVAVLLAAVGLVVLYWTALGWTIGLGDALTLGCAVVFAGHIMVMNATADRVRPMPLCGVQLLVAGALMCAMLPFARDPVALQAIPSRGWRAILWLGTIGTVVPFAIQAQWQPRSTPSRAAVIFTLEPVFATAFAAAVAGAVLTDRDVLGSFLILTGAFTAGVWRGNDARA